MNPTSGRACLGQLGNIALASDDVYRFHLGCILLVSYDDEWPRLVEGSIHTEHCAHG